MASFVPKSYEDEYQIMSTDTPDFEATHHYLEPLIRLALQQHVTDAAKRETLYQQLVADIPVAAVRYLANPKSKPEKMKFSAYFSWYIAQRINA